MNAIGRLLIAMVMALMALFSSSGTAHAGMDNEMVLLHEQGRTLTIQQWDTFLNGVFPLDCNRLTREWFHSGRTKWNVAGADEFEGTMELGYQIGFPWSLGVGINFSYTPPNILLEDASLFPTSNRSPRSSPRTCSPAPRSAPTSATVRESRRSPPSPSTSWVRRAMSRCPTRMARCGAAGGVLLRPFARLIAASGDSVTTYGEPWNMQ